MSYLASSVSPTWNGLLTDTYVAYSLPPHLFTQTSPFQLRPNPFLPCAPTVNFLPSTYYFLIYCVIRLFSALVVHCLLPSLPHPQQNVKSTRAGIYICFASLTHAWYVSLVHEIREKKEQNGETPNSMLILVHEAIKENIINIGITQCFAQSWVLALGQMTDKVEASRHFKWTSASRKIHELRSHDTDQNFSWSRRARTWSHNRKFGVTQFIRFRDLPKTVRPSGWKGTQEGPEDALTVHSKMKGVISESFLAQGWSALPAALISQDRELSEMGGINTRRLVPLTPAVLSDWVFFPFTHF